MRHYNESQRIIMVNSFATLVEQDFMNDVVKVINRHSLYTDILFTGNENIIIVYFSETRR